MERHPVPMNHLLRVARGHQRPAPPPSPPTPETPTGRTPVVGAASRTLFAAMRSLSRRPRDKGDRQDPC